MSIFEQATRKRLRFKSDAGFLSVEDLWRIRLEGEGANLDDLAKGLNKEVKESEEESFVRTSSDADRTLILKLDIVKRVIQVKLEERDKIAVAAEKRVKREKLIDALARKQDEERDAMTSDEIRAALADLEAE